MSTASDVDFNHRGAISFEPYLSSQAPCNRMVLNTPATTISIRDLQYESQDRENYTAILQCLPLVARDCQDFEAG